MPKNKRNQVIAACNRQGYRCYYCSRQIEVNKPFVSQQRPHTATLDHYIPLSQGGKNNAQNRVAACYVCNQKKADAMPDVFLQAGRNADFRVGKSNGQRTDES